MKFYPYEKKGGGGAILKWGGCQKVPLLKTRGSLRGGGRKKFQTRDFPTL